VGGTLGRSSHSLTCLWEQDGAVGVGGLATVVFGVNLVWPGLESALAEVVAG